MRRTRSQSASEATAKPAPSAAGPGAEAAATGGSGRRRASPAAKGKSPAKVETGLPLGNTRKKGRAKAEPMDNASVERSGAEPKDNANVDRCRAGSCENILEERTEAVCDNDAADMDWEEGHVEHSEYSHELGDAITVEFTDDVPSSTNKKSVRRATAEEKELAELAHRVHLLCLIARGRVVDKACNDPLIQASILSLVPNHLLWSVADVPNLKAVNLRNLVSWGIV